MNAKQDIATRESSGVEQPRGAAATTRESARGREPVIVPAVDIFEDAHRLTVQADMPGVSKETLNVQVEGPSLVIEGDMAVQLPASMSALYADLQGKKYRRSFVLSRELETERISASLQDGLLTVTIPKRSEFRPRKINVDVKR